MAVKPARRAVGQSEETKRQYLEISIERPGEDFKFNLNNPA